MRIDPFRALRHAARSSAELAGRLWLEHQPEADRRLRKGADRRHTGHVFEAPNPDSVVSRWRGDGALVADPEPALWVAEVQAADGSRRPSVRMLLGATAAAELEELEDSARPLPGASAIPAIAGDDQRVLRGLITEGAERIPPEWESRVEGYLMRLWRVADPALLRRIQDTLADAPVRALRAVPERGRVLVAVLPLSDPGLQLRPIHRAIQRVPTFREDTFLTLVQGYARVVELDRRLDTAAGRAEATERLAMLSSGYHAVLFVEPGFKGRILRFRQALDLAHIKAVPRNPTLRSLDLALLNSLVLQTVLGIAAPEQPGHNQVFTVGALEELLAQVDRGLFQAGFALNPPPLWEVRAVMEAQQQLPPRTFTIDPPLPQGALFLGDEG